MGTAFAVAFAVGASASNCDAPPDLNLLQLRSATSETDRMLEETDVVGEVLEGRSYCLEDGALPQWLLMGTSKQVAIDCSEDANVCEELKHSLEFTCGGTANLACASVDASTSKVRKGLMIPQRDGDKEQHPCAQLVSKSKGSVKDICFANGEGCGAVMKTTGGTCDATCRSAGFECLSSFKRGADEGKSCGQWWTAEAQTCSEEVDAHAFCMCSVELVKPACERFDGFNFVEGFEHCQAMQWNDRTKKIPTDILRLGNCDEAEWEAVVPAGKLTFTSRPDESSSRVQDDLMQMFVDGEEVEIKRNDVQDDDVVVEIPKRATVVVKAKSRNKIFHLHMTFQNLKSCSTPTIKQLTSSHFHFHDHNFLCSNFETKTETDPSVASHASPSEDGLTPQNMASETPEIESPVVIEATASIQWVLGADGQSCTDACKEQGLTCDEEEMWPQSAEWITSGAATIGIDCIGNSRCDAGASPFIEGGGAKCSYCSLQRSWGSFAVNAETGRPNNLCKRKGRGKKRLCPCV